MKTQTSILFKILTFMVRPRRLFWLATHWCSFLPPPQHLGFVFQGLLLLIQPSVCIVPAADFRVLARMQLALRLTYAPAPPPCQFLTCSQLIKVSIFWDYNIISTFFFSFLSGSSLDRFLRSSVGARGLEMSGRINRATKEIQRWCKIASGGQPSEYWIPSPPRLFLMTFKCPNPRGEESKSHFYHKTRNQQSDYLLNT